MMNRLVDLVKATVLSIMLFATAHFFQILPQLVPWTEGADHNFSFGWPFKCYRQFIVGSNNCDLLGGWYFENLLLNCFIFWLTTLLGYFGWKWSKKRTQLLSPE